MRELKVENQQLQQKIPSTKEKAEGGPGAAAAENENRQLKVQVEYLEKDLSWERGISARLREGIGAALDFLDRHLPEQFRPLVEKARELLPVQRCSSRKESRNGATPGAVWSCKRSLSGGLARAARTGYNNSKNRELTSLIIYATLWVWGDSMELVCRKIGN